MKRTIGWVLIAIGILLPVVATIGSFIAPSAIPGLNVGLILKSLIAGAVGVISGAVLVNQARATEREHTINEIRQLGESKRAEWMAETGGSIPLPLWLKQKGYLDKYKSVVDLDY